MAKKKKVIVMKSVAIIDSDGLYQGLTFIPENELTENHIEVPADCDLAPGGYEWIEEKQAFMPTDAFIKQHLMKG